MMDTWCDADSLGVTRSLAVVSVLRKRGSRQEPGRETADKPLRRQTFAALICGFAASCARAQIA